LLAAAVAVHRLTVLVVEQVVIEHRLELQAAAQALSLL
jgi:hypothetical protein